MPRPLGLPKTGGRKAGTPNRRSQLIADTFDSLGVDVVEELLRLFPKLSPDKRANILVQFLPYLYPRRRPLDPKEENPIAAQLQNMTDEQKRTRLWEMGRRLFGEEAMKVARRRNGMPLRGPRESASSDKEPWVASLSSESEEVDADSRGVGEES